MRRIAAREGERRKPGEAAQRLGPFGRWRRVFEDAAIANIHRAAFKLEAATQQGFSLFQLSRSSIEGIEQQMFGDRAAANDPTIKHVAAKEFAERLAPAVDFGAQHFADE